MSTWQSRLRSLYFKTPYFIRKAIGSIARLFPERFTYGKVYEDTLSFLTKSDDWGRKEFEEYQRNKIHDLIDYCWEQIPFYQKYWKENGFEPSMFKILSDIQKIPTIDKDMISDVGDDFLPRDKSILNKADMTSTGGTSGHQFRFYIDKRRLGIEQAFRVDQWKRFGYEQGDARAVFRGVVDFDGSGDAVYMYEPILNEYRFNVFNMNPKTMSKYVEALQKVKAPFLHGYPSAISYLAQYYAKNGISPPEGLRGVILVSEKPYTHQVRLISDVFKVRVTSFYGMSEKSAMGAECETSSDYHYYPQYGFTEFLTADDGWAKPNQECEIVATGFINTVTPFIRYRTGDTTIYKGRRCTSCKREQPISGPVMGRWGKDVMFGKSGGIFTNTALNMHEGVMRNVEQYQYLQERIGVCELLIVPGIDWSDVDEQRILQAYRAKGGAELKFTIRYVKQLLRTKIGKIPMVMQRIPKSKIKKIIGV